MWQKNKLQLIASSSIILIPLFVSILLWIFFPETIVSKWTGNGTDNGWNTRTALVFLSPLFLLMIHLICALFILKDPKNEAQSSKILKLGLWILPTISLVIGSALIEAATGKDFGLGFNVQLLLSTVFFIFGNYMPKCKPNHSIGIKLLWTLHSEENWKQTHRFTGMLWVAGSIAMFLFMMIFESGFLSGVLPVIIILTAGPILYSFLYYRKQLKEGTVAKAERNRTSPSNRSFTASSVLSVIIIVLIAIIMISGTIQYRFENTAFTVKANYWENITVNYKDIDSIEYRESGVPGKRTFGYDNLSMLMGEFENSEFGAYTRYSYNKCPSCIVLYIGENILVLNQKEETATKELYETLLNKTK